MVAKRFGTLEGGQTESERDDALLASEMRDGKVFRAVVNVLRAEFNRHGTFEADMLAAVAAATNLADLKTRFAALSAVPQRSPSDIMTALKNAMR